MAKLFHKCQLTSDFWWRKPIYWDKYDEPQYIGDVLFNIFVHSFAFFAAFVWAVASLGINYVLTYDGAMTTAMWGVGLTLGWWYLIHRK